jgi:hypothetical protein
MGLAAGAVVLVPCGWFAKRLWRQSGQRSMREIRAVVDHLAANRGTLG